MDSQAMIDPGVELLKQQQLLSRHDRRWHHAAISSYLRHRLQPRTVKNEDASNPDR